MAEDFKGIDANRLLHLPGATVMTLRDCLRKIEAFINHIPSMGFVLLVWRKGDTTQTACTRNVPRSVAREALRTSLNDLDAGRIALADPEGTPIP